LIFNSEKNDAIFFISEIELSSDSAIISTFVSFHLYFSLGKSAFVDFFTSTIKGITSFDLVIRTMEPFPKLFSKIYFALNPVA